MKLFSWVQNKLSRSQSSNKSNIHPSNENQTPKLEAQKEEFTDWPHGFLSIGTLFNKTVKEDIKENCDPQENAPTSTENHVQADFTQEEFIELQKELNELISSDDQEEHDDNEHYTIVPNKLKDVYLDNKITNAISKKSLSFLLKKMFVCGSQLGPSPSLRDPILSPPTTRMNKMLRAILRKKIYPQSPCPSMVRKRCLGSREIGRSNYDEDDEQLYIEGNDSSRWDKTDTDYIVLEI